MSIKTIIGVIVHTICIQWQIYYTMLYADVQRHCKKIMSKEKETLQVIKEQELLGKPFVMYGTIKNPLFVAKDVAEWIGNKNVSQMIISAELDDDQKGIYLIDTLGGIQKLLCLTEDGVYDVLMVSRKKIAKQYKHEIKNILKQIRLTGGYVQKDREDEFIDNYFPSFSDDTKLAMVQDLKKQILKLEPQAEAYQDLMQAEGYLQFLDVASIIECKRNGLLQFLRSKKVLTKQSNFNVPYGRFRDNGMFRVICSKVNNHPTSVTLVSSKGLNYIYKLIKKSKMESEFDCDALVQMSSKGSVA